MLKSQERMLQRPSNAPIEENVASGDKKARLQRLVNSLTDASPERLFATCLLELYKLVEDGTTKR